MKETRKAKYMKYMKLNIALVFFLQLVSVLFCIFFLQIYSAFLSAVAGVTMGVCIQVYECYLRKDKQKDKDDRL